MILAFIAVITGFVLLVWGADRFVAGAGATARNFGVSPLIIGLTIVGFGTSAPEMLVSAMAAIDDSGGLAVGNALGSNIANLALVLGTAALLHPMIVSSGTLRREYPMMFLTMLAALGLLVDGELGRADGILLLVGLLMMIAWVVRLGLRERDPADPMAAGSDEDLPPPMPNWLAMLWLAVGLLVLLVSSRLVVWGATEIALAFGVSDLVVGLTVVAIGTSLPELAATVMSAFKGEHDIAVGNIIGSNMFNILGVLGLPGVIRPDAVAPEAITRDFPFMVALSVALFLMAYGFRGRPGRINRFEGGALLAAYIAYIYALAAGAF